MSINWVNSKVFATIILRGNYKIFMTYRVSHLATLSVRPWEVQGQDRTEHTADFIEKLLTRMMQGQQQQREAEGRSLLCCRSYRKSGTFTGKSFWREIRILSRCRSRRTDNKVRSWNCINTYISHFGRFCPRSLLSLWIWKHLQSFEFWFDVKNQLIKPDGYRKSTHLNRFLT